MTLPIGGLAFLDSNGKVPDAAMPAGYGGITAITGDVVASGTGSVQAVISQAIAASIAAASSNATTALAQIAALAPVASTGSAASLTGTLAAARIADGSLPAAKLAVSLANVATSGLASDLSGTLAAARIADASIVPAKLTYGLPGDSLGAPCYTFYSPVINLVAAPATYVIIPAMPVRCRINSAVWIIYSAGGTRSAGPAFNMGSTSPNFADGYSSQAATGILTQAAFTNVAPGTAVSPVPSMDLTTSGLRVKINTAVTGSSPVLTARLMVEVSFIPV